MNITLRQLQCFRLVADLGSFTRAAQRLKLAQPALSSAIRELESELNLRLFNRTTRKVELTSAGAEFLQSVDRLMAELERAIEIAQDWSEQKRGRFVVAAPPFLASMILPAAISDYKLAYSAIEVRLIDTQTDVIVESVRSGAADFGVGTFADDEEGIREEILFEDTLMVFARADQPIVRATKVSWRELRGAPLIALTRESGIRSLMDEAFDRIGQPVRPTYEVSHITTAIMLANVGLGLAILPAYAWGFARSFDLVAKPLHEPIMKRKVAIIRSSARSLSPAAEQFTRFLRKHAKFALPRALRPK